MEPDATLDWILRLRDELDAAVESGLAPSVDSVYALVGLIDELDRWLAAGRTPPSRWRAALAAPVLAPVVLREQAASNDGVPTKHRMPRTRTRRNHRENTAQLALALALGGERA